MFPPHNVIQLGRLAAKQHIIPNIWTILVRYSTHIVNMTTLVSFDGRCLSIFL